MVLHHCPITRNKRTYSSHVHKSRSLSELLKCEYSGLSDDTRMLSRIAAQTGIYTFKRIRKDTRFVDMTTICFFISCYWTVMEDHSRVIVSYLANLDWKRRLNLATGTSL
jgi:hypothetical protein